MAVEGTAVSADLQARARFHGASMKEKGLPAKTLLPVKPPKFRGKIKQHSHPKLCGVKGKKFVRFYFCQPATLLNPKIPKIQRITLLVISTKAFKC